MRQLRGMEIVARGGFIKRIKDSHYQVRSSGGDKWYNVRWEKGSWYCECPDYAKRLESCKHIYAITFLLKLPHTILINYNYDLFTCPTCGAEPEQIVGNGKRQNKSGSIHRLRCKNCGYKFTDRIGFTKMRNNPFMILLGLDLYFKGLSVRQIQHHLSSMYANEISHMSVYRWLKRYTNIISGYVKNLTANVGAKWHADEMIVKIDGKKAYLWNVLDAKTRYLLASEITTGRSIKDAYSVLDNAIKSTKVRAEEITTDGLQSYKKALEKLNIKKHLFKPKFTDPENNNVIERINETLRQRYSLTRSLGDEKNAKSLADGIKLHYNFIRPHSALKGQTPSEAAKIQTKGRNKWLALTIQATRKCIRS